MKQRVCLTPSHEGDAAVKRRRLALSLVGLTVLLTAGVVTAQWQRRGGYRGYGFDPTDGRVYDRQGVPEWQNDPEFKKDVFTFVRIRYTSESWGWRRGGGWRTDWPASDLNLSFRL